MRTSTEARVRERITGLADGAGAPVALIRESVGVIGRAMHVDRWCGMTLDPATILPTGGYHDEGLPPALVPRLIEIEYGSDDVGAFSGLAATRAGALSLATATGGVPERSLRYRDVLLPAGLPHELRVVLRAGGEPWGALVLLRADDAPPFAAAEVAAVARLGPAIGEGVRRSLVLGAVGAGADRDAPAVMILRLGPSPVVESSAPPLAAWREALDDGDDGSPGGLPYPVAGLALTALNRPGGVARSRARGRDGAWMTMHATTLDPEARRVAIVRQPSRPHEILSLALDAHGVSAREREVVALALRGLGNAAIAERLVISPLTVQDHLKSVFRKLGVAGRTELTARLLTEHYGPRLAAGAAPGPDGALAPPRP